MTCPLSDRANIPIAPYSCEKGCCFRRRFNTKASGTYRYFISYSLYNLGSTNGAVPRTKVYKLHTIFYQTSSNVRCLVKIFYTHDCHAQGWCFYLRPMFLGICIWNNKNISSFLTLQYRLLSSFSFLVPTPDLAEISLDSVLLVELEGFEPSTF